jgi:poly(3-hydroxybutyrate) depolymerase
MRPSIAVMAFVLKLSCCMILLLPQQSTSIAAPTPLSNTEAARRLKAVAGAQKFIFRTPAGIRMTVWSYRPSKVLATTPVLFVMHGVQRDGARYLLDWIKFGRTFGYIIVVPQFDQADFPGSAAYNYGNFQGKQNGTFRPRAQWSFSIIEPLFARVRKKMGTSVKQYRIYGHSAGAQFVHRFVFFVPEARYSLAIAANAGSYAVPDLSIAYPFGLGQTPVTETNMSRALGRPLTILLGTADNDPSHPSLPDQPGAVAQGPYRVARGQHFFAVAQQAAQKRKIPMRWLLSYVKGIGHDNAGMATAASCYLRTRRAISKPICDR